MGNSYRTFTRKQSGVFWGKSVVFGCIFMFSCGEVSIVVFDGC